MEVVSGGLKAVASDIQAERLRTQNLDRDSAKFKSDTETQVKKSLILLFVAKLLYNSLYLFISSSVTLFLVMIL